MPLHGRESERERISMLIEAARDGDGGCLLLHGVAGVGKSSLLEEAVAGAGAARVLRATGTETERELPFSGLHQMLHGEAARIDELPDPQAAALRSCLGIEMSSAPPDRFLLATAVLGLLGEAAADGSVLCVVDDIQWIDAGSLDALLFSSRRLAGSGVAMLLACRDGEDLVPDSLGVPRLHIGGLSPTSGRRLLGDVAGVEVSSEVAAALSAHTEGNALALAELAIELTADELSGRAPLREPLPVSAGVERIYAGRIASLDEDERLALLIASASGGAGLEVARSAALSVGVPAAAFGRVEAKHWFDAGTGEILFRHPLLRAAAYAAADPSDRRRAHRAIAEALDEEDERRAWQLGAAAVGPDPDVVDALIRVADRARDRGAAAASSAALERAAELSADPRQRARLLTDAAEDAWMAGRAPHALRLIALAREGVLDDGQADRLQWLQGTIDAWGARPAEGVEALCSQAERMTERDPERALELLAEAAEPASFTANPALAARVGAIASGVPEPEGDPAGLLRHRLLNGTNLFASGEVEKAMPLLLDAIRIGSALDDPHLLNLAGRAAIYIGDDAKSLELDRRAAEIARAEGALVLLPSILIRTQISEQRTGRLAAAESSGAEAVALAEATGQTDLVACGLAFAALVFAERGSTEEATDHADRAMSIATERDLVLFVDIARAALAHLDLVNGEPIAALARADSIVHPAARLIALLDTVEASLAAGREDATSAALELAGEWAKTNRIGIAEAIRLHCLALAGAQEEMAVGLEAAIAAYAELDRPFERARAELAMGEALRRRRLRAESRGFLRAAQERFERIGADVWAERAVAELRASGQTARRRDPSTLDDLTPQEVQVARLVAEGNTNREAAAKLFLSPRTIDFHLRNVFRKLGIKSRTELARLDLDEAASPSG
ncbi:MAG: AAA family ATPase [Solirubrobacterales bacterium]